MKCGGGCISVVEGNKRKKLCPRMDMPEPARAASQPKKRIKGKLEVEAGVGLMAMKLRVTGDKIQDSAILSSAFDAKVLFPFKHMPRLSMGIGVFGWIGRFKDKIADGHVYEHGKRVVGVDVGPVASYSIIKRRNFQMDIEASARAGVYSTKAFRFSAYQLPRVTRPYIAAQLGVKLYLHRNFFFNVSMQGGGDISRYIGLMVKDQTTSQSGGYTQMGFFQALLNLGYALPW